jgi:deoxyribonuclease-4
MEIPFTYGVRMGASMAEQAGALARELRVRLSVHAPYYINLASREPEKVSASRQRLLEACHRAHLMGAGPVVFHPGFYQGRSEATVYRLIRREIDTVQEAIEKACWQVRLCPEITGKPSQFGSLEEILALRADTGCGITADFAHLYARQQGEVDYGGIIAQLPEDFHAHFSGIAIGPKGEERHLPTTEAFFRPLADALLSAAPRVRLICESPRPLEDAVMMKRVLAEGGLHDVPRRAEPDIGVQ